MTDEEFLRQHNIDLKKLRGEQRLLPRLLGGLVGAVVGLGRR